MTTTTTTTFAEKKEREHVSLRESSLSMFTTRMLRRAMTHAAASSSSSTARQSTIKSTKQVMELTEAAAKRIHELLGNKGAEYLKIGIRTRGCNGMTYTMNYADEKDRGKFDEVVDQHGVKVIIEPNALMSIIGTKMDFVSDNLRSEFTFENPNAKASCGCGESFSV